MKIGFASTFICQGSCSPPVYDNDCRKGRIEQPSDGADRILAKGSGTALTLFGGESTPKP